MQEMTKLIVKTRVQYSLVMQANGHIFFRSNRQDRLQTVFSFKLFKNTFRCIFVFIFLQIIRE